MLKKIILSSILMFNAIICYIFFVFQNIEATDLYFVHIQIITILTMAIYGYELKFGKYRFLQEINNLIDYPITKAKATLLDLKIFYKSPLFLAMLFVNYFIVFAKWIIYKDSNAIQPIIFTLFSISIIFLFVNLTSFLKGVIGFQAYLITFYSSIFIFQFLNFRFYSFEILLPMNLNFWIIYIFINISLLFSRQLLFKNWIA